MREEYDFSKAAKNPCVQDLQPSVTIELDKPTADYFKELSEDMHLPYQPLINAYLADCADKKRKPQLIWGKNLLALDIK